MEGRLLAPESLRSQHQAKDDEDDPQGPGASLRGTFTAIRHFFPFDSGSRLSWDGALIWSTNLPSVLVLPMTLMAAWIFGIP